MSIIPSQPWFKINELPPTFSHVAYLERGGNVSPIHNQVYFAFSLDAGVPRHEYSARDPDATNAEHAKYTAIKIVLMESPVLKAVRTLFTFSNINTNQGHWLSMFSLPGAVSRKPFASRISFGSLWLPCEVGPMITSIFQMRPLRLREGKLLPSKVIQLLGVAQWRFETGT